MGQKCRASMLRFGAMLLNLSEQKVAQGSRNSQEIGRGYDGIFFA